MEKIDFKKTLDSYRAAPREFRELEIPEMRYLAVDGHGDPNTPGFTHALEALYPVAYALKFDSKRRLDRDYVVPPLEGLWWADDMSAFTTARDKSRWHWRVLLMIPEWLDDAAVGDAIDSARAKKSPERIDDVRVETLTEGHCVQLLHVGAFDDEGGVLAQLHDGYLPEHNLRPAGSHHEIYLSDFRRVAPERQRTILRQPVASA